jgi:hypothetical protein
MGWHDAATRIPSPTYSRKKKSEKRGGTEEKIPDRSASHKESGAAYLDDRHPGALLEFDGHAFGMFADLTLECA